MAIFEVASRERKRFGQGERGALRSVYGSCGRYEPLGAAYCSIAAGRLRATRMRSATYSSFAKCCAESSADGSNRQAEGDALWQLETARGPMEFDGVIVSLPAAHTARVLRQDLPELASMVGTIEYASSAVAVLIVNKADIKGRIDGFGLIDPRKENRRTLAISYSSNKYAGRTPDDQILLRVFSGRRDAPELVDEPESRLIEMACDELRGILGWNGRKTHWQAIVRWKNAMPQYHVGHMKRLEVMDRLIAEQPQLQLCGAAYRGVASHSAFAKAVVPQRISSHR